MKTALVMTGVTDRRTLEASLVRPDYVLNSIADLEGLLQERRNASPAASRSKYPP